MEQSIYSCKGNGQEACINLLHSIIAKTRQKCGINDDQIRVLNYVLLISEFDL